jgi:type II secretory ATPase GspE/PulE/Tfp pilus assembly ATPase PilB-like protein
MSDAAKATIEKVLVQIPEGKRGKIDVSKGLKIWKGKGCAKCGGSGMKGRIGIFEVFSMGADVTNLLADKVEEDELRKVAIKSGMTTMKQDGILKVLGGETTLEEVERVTDEGFVEID